MGVFGCIVLVLADRLYGYGHQSEVYLWVMYQYVSVNQSITWFLSAALLIAFIIRGHR